VGGVAHNINVAQNFKILVFGRWNMLRGLGLNAPWRASGDVSFIRRADGETFLFR